MEKNLTTGSVFKNVILFSLPYLLSYFLHAGVVQNARINDFVVDVEDTTVIANSLNKKAST